MDSVREKSAAFALSWGVTWRFFAILYLSAERIPVFTFEILGSL